jgi:hypothetical protein
MDISRELKLINFVKANLGRPFVWGECDCNVFALEMIDAVHGTDLAGRIKGKYANELGAVRFRLRSEWGSFEGLLKENGFVEGKKGFEQTGDILIVAAPNFELVHIYMGKTVVSVPLGMIVHTAPYALMKYLEYRVWRKAS